MKWNFSLLKRSLVFKLSSVEGELTSLIIRCSPDERTWYLKAVEGMTGLHLECPQPQRKVTSRVPTFTLMFILFNKTPIKSLLTCLA